MIGGAHHICLCPRQLTVLADRVTRQRNNISGWSSDVPWVAWNPHFGEPKDLDAIRSSLVYKLDGLVDAPVEVVPHRLGLDGSDSDGFLFSGSRIHVCE